jgi:hypothetical protein
MSNVGTLWLRNDQHRPSLIGAAPLPSLKKASVYNIARCLLTNSKAIERNEPNSQRTAQSFPIGLAAHALNH